MPIIRPAEPVITPADRSNSPPIISSATATAGIPIVDATSVQFAMPSRLAGTAGSASRRRSRRRRAPAARRSPGGAGAAPSVLIWASRSSATGCGGGRPAAPAACSTVPWVARHVCSPRGAAAGRRRGRPARGPLARAGLPASFSTVAALVLSTKPGPGEDRLAAADGVRRWSCRASGTRSAGSPAGTAAGRRRTAMVPAWMSLMTCRAEVERGQLGARARALDRGLGRRGDVRVQRDDLVVGLVGLRAWT